MSYFFVKERIYNKFVLFRWNFLVFELFCLLICKVLSVGQCFSRVYKIVFVSWFLLFLTKFCFSISLLCLCWIFYLAPCCSKMFAWPLSHCCSIWHLSFTFVGLHLKLYSLLPKLPQLILVLSLAKALEWGL